MVKTWKELVKEINGMGEQELMLAINLEASSYKRKAIITRLHQRYAKLRSQRERDGLLAGTFLL